MNIEQEENSETKSFGDSDFLAMNDKAIRNFRENENDAKRKIVKKMITLRHNMKYNKHLLSVYMKAKALFDKMVDEHRSQLQSLDEIYRHLNHLIRENMSKIRIHSKNSVSSNMMTELIKDKKRIGLLVKQMRNSYDKLMNIDTVLGATVDKVNEITFMDDDEENDSVVDVDGVDGDEEESVADDEDGVGDDEDIEDGVGDEEDIEDSEDSDEEDIEDSDEEDSDEEDSEEEDSDEEDSDEEDIEDSEDSDEEDSEDVEDSEEEDVEDAEVVEDKPNRDVIYVF
jgi:hypothetical protein